MKYYTVFDLEASCWNRADSLHDEYKQRNEMEIIEIGAVKVTEEFEIIEEFQTFCKPIMNPVLSEFCKSLTTITQDQVNYAPGFKEVYRNFLSWAGNTSKFISWGKYDYNQITKDCLLHNMTPFKESRFQNGKELFEIYTGQRGKGLGTMVKKYNLVFEGIQHRGLCDAKMIARVLQKAQEEYRKQHEN